MIYQRSQNVVNEKLSTFKVKFIMSTPHHLYIGIPPECSVYLDSKAWSPYKL